MYNYKRFDNELESQKSTVPKKSCTFWIIFFTVLLSVVLSAVYVFLVAPRYSNEFEAFVQKEWTKFKSQHSKEYKTKTEEQRRISIFKKNVEKIHKHNQAYENGDIAYKLGINKFTDLEHSEFKMMKKIHFQRTKSPEKIVNDLPANFIEPVDITIPSSINWREKGAVTNIKDQEDCGSCYAFAAIGALEGQYFLKTGQLVSLSEQNIVDCSFNDACDGGLAYQAFQYIKENGGIDTEAFYPYTAEEGDCKYNPLNSSATVDGYVKIPEGDERKLAEAIATIGPIAVDIDASDPTFQHYEGGIYQPKYCDTSDEYLHHAVLVIGYDQDSYLVKNSWGTTWGENGYFRIARNKENQCGIATSAVYPIV
ncbi:cathepsin L1-like [Contarinia nasturtii]|uniref:cathepsin L1-like n=1 Tax=Contarinia nasturtii TaxID=265458 RepID=UPI0012D3D1D8|nr:cathepsin L1-like [Contarinia nasturtii]